MSAWIGPTTGETAEQFLTRLGTLKDHYETETDSGTSVAYARSGLVLRQKCVSTTAECHGLTKEGATLLLSLQSDSTTSTTYYSQIGSTGEYAAVSITSGTLVNVRARRENEANGWGVSITTSSYSADDATGWTTIEPSGASISCSVHRSTRTIWSELQHVDLETVTTVTEQRYQASAATTGNSSSMVSHSNTRNGTHTVYRPSYNFSTGVWNWTAAQEPVSDVIRWETGTVVDVVSTWNGPVEKWTVTTTTSVTSGSAANNT